MGRGEILDLILAIIFAMQIARAYRKGIYRRYRTYENNDSKLKGRINVARHIRLNPIFNGNIAYSSREYTADNDMNRMILTAYTSLQKRQPGLMRELEKKYTPVKDFISQLKNIMQPASRQEARKLVQKERKKITHAVYSDWESVRKTAILILKYMGIAPEDDGTNINGVLIDMNLIWEKYLVQIVKEQLAERNLNEKYKCKSKEIFKIFEEQHNKNDYRKIVYSDEMIEEDKKKLIIDAKYKNGWEKIASSDKNRISGDEVRDDCFQIMSYMYRLQCSRGGIFCPQTGEARNKKYDIFPDDSNKKEAVTLFSLRVDELKDSQGRKFESVMKEREEELFDRILEGLDEMEQIYNEGLENGELKKAKEVALSMAEDGMKAEKIARYLKVDAIMVQKWINESSSVTQKAMMS